MNQNVKVIAIDAALAILIVILYSPGLLALRPDDPSILRAGFSIIFGVVIAVALVWFNYNALRTRRYEHLDTSGGADEYDLAEVLKRYVHDPVVGQYASRALDEIEGMSKKKSSLYDIIAGKFEKGSLSWDKFTAVVDAAAQTVLKNTALLANRVQSFDVEEYRTMGSLIQTGGYKSDEIPDDIQEEKWQLLQRSLDDMRGVVAANERLLLELDKFSIELGQLESASNSEVNNNMLDEIRTLIDETKYYQ